MLATRWIRTVGENCGIQAALRALDEQRWIRKIVLGRHRLDIHFSPSGLAHDLLPGGSPPPFTDDSDDTFQLTLPVNLKRCGIESRLIIPSLKTAPKPHIRSVGAIQAALRKALAWNQELLAGAVPSMTAIAERERVTQRRIAHLLPLAFLAPDIMEAIFQGEIPASLTLDRLKRGFPRDWNQQRLELGFASPAREAHY